jgi:hypothetical protein
MSCKRRRNATLSKAAVAYFQSAAVVRSQEDIAAMQVRIAKAESERDSWRVSGRQEKYLEAYSMVEALELQLERLRQAAPPVAARTDETLPEGERLMAEFSIAFNGRHYLYGPYRYDHLADAVNYARLQGANPSSEDRIGAMPAPEQQVEAPSESQRQLMSTLAITYQDGVYRLGAYRYDRLTDAVDYARLVRS